MPSQEDKKRADDMLKKAYRENYTAIYRFCLSRLKEDRDSVEDIVQESFVVLYQKFLSGEEITYVSAFLYKTAGNLLKKRYAALEKTQKIISLDEVLEIPSQQEDIDDRLTFEQYSRQISAALNDKDAEIFSLRYIEELKIDEVAARMNMSIPAVTTRLSRMRSKLQKLLGEEFSR